MKYFYMFVASLLLSACTPALQKGSYVTYTSDEYVFIDNTFITRSMDCVELGEMKQGGLYVKYCVGLNYASKVVEGFVFEHEYKGFNERFVGSTLSFKTKDIFKIQCSSETKDGADSGKEYINCMIPKADFDLYTFIQNSPEDIDGEFKAAVGDTEVFKGVIGAEGKSTLKKFYEDIISKNRKDWKKRSL